MKKIYALVLLATFFIGNAAFACTTFFLQKNGQMVFGRNYDWVTATGAVHTNLKGLVKTSFSTTEEKKINWISKYGSITFNQYGKEFPNGGMNETGLVVELMWLSESKYPGADSRPALSVLQWIQYQLDNCTTVDEVIATDKAIRIESNGAPQHYLVADSKGKVATIEFLQGKMVVPTGADLPYPVLANSTYTASAKAVKNAFEGKSSAAATFNDNSLGRFATACTMVQQYHQAATKKPLVDYSFNILSKVSQGNFTKWSIVYDISNRKIFYKTQGFQQIKTFAFNAFDFSCSATPLAFNMNQNFAGDVSKRFADYSNSVNKTLLKRAFAESKSQINIPEVLQDRMVNVAAAVKCEK